MMMSQPLTDTSMKKKLTYSQQGSLANHTPLQENVRHLVMSVIYGVKSSEFWGKRNQDSSWERTCQDSLPLSLEDSSEEYSMTWNPWGIVSGGLLMEPRISEQYTVEIEFSSLPTPTATDSVPYTGGELYQTKTGSIRARTKNGKSSNRGLEATLKFLATSTASQDYKPIRPLSPSEANGTHGRTLVADIGREMLPTPTASEQKYRLKGNSQQSKCLEAKARRGELINSSLEEIGDNGKSAPRLGLNPQFVEAMMGFPTGWTDLRL